MMAALPYALSVHHFVSQVGDYVGFAAIVAVAIMVLLLFAHARETAELRRRAEFAEDELLLLHEQVEWLRDTQQSGDGSPGAATSVGGAAGAGRMPGAVVSPPASAQGVRGERTAGSGAAAGAGVAGGAAALATGAGSGSATSTGAAGTVAPVPAPASAARGRAVVFGAPVGVGAPALSSATKLIPPPDEELRAVAAAAEPAGRADPAAEARESSGRGGAVAAPPAPPPATAAAGGNGKAPRRSGIAADAGAPGAGGRPAYPAAATSPRRNYGAGEERSGGRRISRGLIAAVTVLVAVIVVVAVILLTGVVGGSSNKNSNQAAANQTSTAGNANAKSKNAAKAKAKGATVKVTPQTVTVAVLNGTTTPNLAAAVSDKLSTKGFQQGATGNAADQTTQAPATIVGYMPDAPGAKNDAYAVAVALGLKPTAVKPVSTASQSVACSGTPTNCPDQVIVTVGADLNSDAA